MKRICIAVLAHVDAGKTSTAESLLYESGMIKTPGRVDHGDTFLDTERLEKQRKITIFSKQALLEGSDFKIFLLDTPGHTDFGAEAERVLYAADYALLVISAPEGVQAHTWQLWKLLKRSGIPVFVWVNKMDICERPRSELIAELCDNLGDGFIDFSDDTCRNSEELASFSEKTIEEYLENGCVSDDSIRELIAERKVFPCFFGSALKFDGTDRLLKGLLEWTIQPKAGRAFGARVFKITHGAAGERLSWLRLSGGSLKLRDIVEDEKITQIRVYNGGRFEAVQELHPGEVAAVAGLSHSYAGQGLGFEKDCRTPLLEAAIMHRISFTDGTDPKKAYLQIKRLADEDPQLKLSWNEVSGEITAHFMGQVQIEVLEKLIEDRFGYEAEISPGEIIYKETIAAPVEGVGHFEPLRHYAEAHILLEPLPPGSGLIFESAVRTDDLNLNWQRLILGELEAKKHIGVLVGGELTDVKMTLVAGRAHLKHTEGGDFRQAALRAVRQCLRSAENILLEPFYSFRASMPHSCVGRAASDFKAMHAVFETQDHGESMQLFGRGPVSELSSYLPVFQSYTRGLGKLLLRFDGYYPCHDTEKVIEASGYDADRDIENPADSVFCSHGSGIIVRWDKVREFMHVDSGLRIGGADNSEPSVEMGVPRVKAGNLDFDEKELEAIMQREFGPIKRPKYSSVVYNRAESREKSAAAKKDYIIVDGYNIIYAWDDLRELSETDIDAARDRLITRLVNFSNIRNKEVVAVFDAYRVKGGEGSAEDIGGVRVVFTKGGESADAYIERLVHETGKSFNVKIASSDGMIQIAALRMGVLRISARELQGEVEAAEEILAEKLDEQRRSDTFSNTPRQV